jgi:uncharacterized protein
MKNAEYWIEHLQLKPHPEGGFFRESYRSVERVDKNALPTRFHGDRNFSTAIYFLLRSRDKSMFHRIKSDELWHFYDGAPLTVFVLGDDGLSYLKLGRSVEKNELPQIVIPANVWFAATVNDADSYTLAGCTVSPAFDFEDFELADRDMLVGKFPQHRLLIEFLTIAQ